MRTHYQSEVLSAVYAAMRPDDTLISRQRIEDEVERNPAYYPGLAGRTRIGRRRIITRAMNQSYSFWCESRGVHPSSFVWHIRDLALDLHHTSGVQE
ncbi:hypothetical protein KHC33_15295 [Methanospirillum sp. J.3.6.1-F.2.7.3]|uniref:Uncharacterized protein n=1 Tax=Methanospirillum purgamenti TaxID=2834276 RepID=A0A8E7EJP2_9EURY|nr:MULTISPECIES: hypothetical protein [Methanospirillum]MDX8548978.1 hypothetical protein [Methanospirillum hungatei]QVV88665.1 hypothetical protein KHC33_15295 [Methanospirillum sp. J.3.6.1-F.2.7.3]